MRLRVSLEAEGGVLRAPVQYNHLLQGLIYTNLDRSLSRWLHDKGHSYRERRFKLFSSRLFGKREARNGHICFVGPSYFYLGSVDSEVLGSFAEHLLTKPVVRLGSARCRVAEVGVEPKPRVDRSEPGTPVKPPEPCGRSPGRPKGRRSGRAKRYPASKRPPEPAKTVNADALLWT